MPGLPLNSRGNHQPRILVVGSLNADLVQRVPRLPAPGETLSAKSLQIFSGGKGANQACAAALLGGNAAIAGLLGDDSFAGQILHDLKQAGVDTSMISRSHNPTGAATILVLPNGDNCIVLSPGANADLSAEFAAEAAGQLEAGDLLLCQLEVPLTSVEAALHTAFSKGVTTILDPAPAVALHSGLLKQVSILTPNQVEAAFLLGSDRKISTIADALEAARALQKLGTSTVIVKMGELGCAVVENGKCYAVPAIPTEAVDTTAAGDTFNGALATARSENLPLKTAVEFACLAAAISVTRHGAIASMPNRTEVDSTPLRESLRFRQ